MVTGEITFQIQVVINQLLFMEKKNQFDFEGIRLYPAEIHLILETNGNQAVNATRIAKKMSITKGAISQTLTRLEKKGMIEKIKDISNKNELSIVLTPLGKKAYCKYKEFYEAFYGHFHDIILQYSEDEQTSIMKFLYDFEQVIKTISL